MSLSTPLRYVELDPDGAQGDSWLYVIVEADTGVVYVNQCAGFATEQRKCQGYLVPVEGHKTDPREGHVDPAELAAIFHDGAICLGYGQDVAPLSDERLEALDTVIRAIPFWTVNPGTTERTRHSLLLDRSQLARLAEAWAPVITPVGKGVLVWKNCD